MELVRVLCSDDQEIIPTAATAVHARHRTGTVATGGATTTTNATAATTTAAAATTTATLTADFEFHNAGDKADSDELTIRTRL